MILVLALIGLAGFIGALTHQHAFMVLAYSVQCGFFLLWFLMFESSNEGQMTVAGWFWGVPIAAAISAFYLDYQLVAFSALCAQWVALGWLAWAWARESD